MRVLIAGAGIGGLTAALALRQAGFDAHVYEQAAVLREVGAGLAVGPNAVRVLHRLGLAEALRSRRRRPHSWDLRDWQSGARPGPGAARRRGGRPLGRAVLPRAPGGSPRCAARRRSAISTSRSARVASSVEQHGKEVTVRFADGRHATGDLLIGADGIHSVVREYVAGPDQPIWWPQIAWRGLAPAAIGHEVGLEVRHHLFWGPRVHVRDLLRLVGPTGELGRLHAERRDWREESWSARGDRDEALSLFAGGIPRCGR